MKQIATKAALVAAIAVTSMSAQAEIVRIGAGSVTGEYSKTIVPAISEHLRKQGRGLSAVPVNLAGSQEIVEKIKSGEIVAGVSQMDVAAAAKAQDEDESLAMVGRLGVEALLCAVRKDGRLHTYWDLIDDRDRPWKVSVGKKRSGTAATWNFIMSQDENLDDSKVKLLYKRNLTIELGRLASGNRDAVCQVIMPNPKNKFIKQVADNDNLEFMTFVAPEYVNFKVGGKQVYDFMRVPVTPGAWGFGAKKVPTLVTWATLVINEDNATDVQLDGLASAAMDSELIPPNSLAAKGMTMFKKAKVALDEFAKGVRR